MRTSWLVAGKTAAFAFTIAIPMLLVRRLPQYEFGLYKQIFLVVNSAVTLLPLGFGMTAFYFLPRDECDRGHTVFNILLFTTGISTIFATALIFFPHVLVVLFNDAGAVAFAPWIAVITVLMVVGSVLEVVIVANQEIRLATGVILLIQVTRALLFVAAAAFSGTIRAVLVAAVAQGAVQVVALLWYLSSRFPGFWREFDWAFLRRQMGYALPFGVAGLLYSLQRDLHNYYVSNRFGAAAYAVYSIGCFQLPLFGILAESVGSVMIPHFSMLQRDGNRREIVLLSARAMRKLALIYFPSYVLLMIMRREFVLALFTDRYAASIPIFAVNLTLIPLSVFVLDPVIRAFSAHRYFPMKLHLALLACFAVALPLAVSRFGLMGAIGVVVGLTCLALVAGLIKVVQILGVRARDLGLFRDLGTIAAAAVTAGVIAAGVRSMAVGVKPLVALAMCGTAFSLAYAAAVAAFGIVTTEERAVLLKYLQRLGRWPTWQERSAVPVGE